PRGNGSQLVFHSFRRTFLVGYLLPSHSRAASRSGLSMPCSRGGAEACSYSIKPEVEPVKPDSAGRGRVARRACPSVLATPRTSLLLSRGRHQASRDRMKRAASHYHDSASARYFEYQRRIGALGGRLNSARDRLLFSRFAKPVAHMRTTRLGSEYGGVHVPVQLLTDKSIVYSAGVGEDVTFDLALIEAVGCDIWALDPTPRSIEFARSIRESRFHF